MKISTEELSVKAYKMVKDMILTGHLKPGQKIIQDTLAQELGISRTPIRTALQMLENEFMIKSLPRKGMVVKEFTNQEILEIYDCRIALESLAVKAFTKIANKTDIDKLYKLFKPFHLSENIDQEKYQKADSVFHETIIKNSGNSYLERLFHNSNLLYCINLIGLIRPAKETLDEHLEIIEAIQQKNADLAEKLMCVHLEKSKTLILKKIN